MLLSIQELRVQPIPCSFMKSEACSGMFAQYSVITSTACGVVEAAEQGYKAERYLLPSDLMNMLCVLTMRQVSRPNV